MICPTVETKLQRCTLITLLAINTLRCVKLRIAKYHDLSYGLNQITKVYVDYTSGHKHLTSVRHQKREITLVIAVRAVVADCQPTNLGGKLGFGRARVKNNQPTAKKTP